MDNSKRASYAQVVKAFTCSIVQMWKRCVMELESEINNRPKKHDDLITGCLLFLFVVLWTWAGPQ